jgi:hypothetical protein
MKHPTLDLLLRKAKRSPMVAALYTLGNWPQRQPSTEGLTVVIACMRRLLPLAIANVRLLQRSNASSLKELVLVFDCEREELGAAAIAQLNTLSTRFPLRLVFYSAYQSRIMRMIDWGWCYAWHSWTLGLSASTTRHVLLQDLDALVLNDSFIQNRYTAALAHSTIFHGVRRYQGLGVTEEMNCAVTYELILDVDRVQSTFRRIDAFNHLTVLEHRLVDFDTLLWIQHRMQSTSVSSIVESDLLHPSQLICNHTDLLNNRPIITYRQHSLALVPYYFHLADESSTELSSFADALHSGTPEISGHPVPLGHISSAQWAWMEKMCRGCEDALFGGTRPAVEHYLSGFAARARNAP